ncbi:hypothetical protein PV327_005201 [Microctonus hyperodae]|uniref:Uncharacterized protein n=1 Tax=Microctonus hyperodae TaxID=165561 RepID=A0AA39G2B5_MICHY|nr:hypothetical protein PV327_005201 [Microctonus hyperodae]
MVHGVKLVAIMEEFIVDKDTMDTDSLEIEATQLSSGPTKLDLTKGGLSRIPESILAFSATEEILLGHNRLTNPNSNLKILHKVVGASKCDFAGPFEQQDRASARRDPSTCQVSAPELPNPDVGNRQAVCGIKS